jgi:Rieske 2Fe-2S family protein
MSQSGVESGRWSVESIGYGRSLSRALYSDPEVFEADLRMLTTTQWLLVDHASRIPAAGDYFLFDIGCENLIIVRDKAQQVRGFYNVCRHRGSRVCLQPHGHVGSFVCPYHAWSYDLDGRLRGAAAMPEGFDKSAHGLKPVHIRTLAGFIFVNLSAAALPDFEHFADRFRPYLAPHGFESAKVAVRVSYPTEANWKLVVENFKECYHCKPAHPTYCSVHDPQKLLAFGAGPGSASGDLAERFHGELKQWERETQAKGHPVGMFTDDASSTWFQTACRLPIGRGYVTEALGGKPVAPLMGSFAEYDGGQTAIVFNPISYIMASNDHAAVMRFTPRGPLQTDVETLWVVRGDAVEGRDYDPQALIKVWDVTLREDKVITENNQLGVLSHSYAPGPHSLHETRISDFLDWYGRRMRAMP